MSEHLFRYDPDRADVVVAALTPGGRPGLSYAVTDTPTLTCVQCGHRLAHISAPNGRVVAAFGVDLESLVRTGKKLPACKPFGSADGREVSP